MALYFNMKTLREKNRIPFIGWCIALSVFLHLSIFAYRVSKLVDLDHLKEQENLKTPIEISEVSKNFLAPREHVPPQPKKPKQDIQIAETEDANNREVDPNAKFLGEHNQKAMKETRAQRIDDFRAKKGTGSKSFTQDQDAAIPPTGENDTKESPSEEIAEGTGVAEEKTKSGVKRDWKTLSLKDLGVGGDGGAEAATDDQLKGVDRGEGTVLSTREFKFYSYYHRIKELLRQYWKPNVERQVARIWNKGKQIRGDELVTKVAVVLDQSGRVHKISKVASSGFSELDEAAIDAFQRAAPFPNPPKAIVDPDGFVRISWDFILQTSSGPVIQFRSYGAAPY